MKCFLNFNFFIETRERCYTTEMILVMLADTVQTDSPVGLIDLHVAVELLQFFFQQLQVRVDEAQLQSHSFSYFVVVCCSTR